MFQNDPYWVLNCHLDHLTFESHIDFCEKKTEFVESLLSQVSPACSDGIHNRQDHFWKKSPSYNREKHYRDAFHLIVGCIYVIASEKKLLNILLNRRWNFVTKTPPRSSTLPRSVPRLCCIMRVLQASWSPPWLLMKLPTMELIAKTRTDSFPSSTVATSCRSICFPACQLHRWMIWSDLTQLPSYDGLATQSHFAHAFNQFHHHTRQFEICAQ